LVKDKTDRRTGREHVPTAFGQRRKPKLRMFAEDIAHSGFLVHRERGG